MDAATQAVLRTRLVDERERLIAELAEMVAGDRELLSEASGENAYRDHMADQGTATFEREMGMTLEENARESLAEVVAALERIDAGTYGICERCSAVISNDRMDAVPTAKLCITCKEAEER